MSKYKIESVSLVGKKSRRQAGPPTQYPLAEVAVGESFLVPADGELSAQKRRLRNVFYYQRNQGKLPEGAQFSFIEVPEDAPAGQHTGIRVGRVK